MALTRAFIDSHITRWEATLGSSDRPYRAKWPSRLFHHAPIENAVKILTEGHLRSRTDPKNKRAKDVAASAVIDNRAHAHGSARLYFRPRTPTQWNIEGIRKANDCKFGEQSHAPVLIMLVFDARQVLAANGVSFCDRNMQLASAQSGSSEDYFSGIPFDKVFHEGGTGGDVSIKEHRCAEVLANSPLPLEGALQQIYCRSPAERDTLINLLDDARGRWEGRIVVSSDLVLFHREYCFVEEIVIAENGIIFELNPRQDRRNVSISLKAWDGLGNLFVEYSNPDFPTNPAPPEKRWRVEKAIPDGMYLVQIELEGHLAFKGYLARGNQLF